MRDLFCVSAAGEKMHLEGVVMSTVLTDVGGKRWSNDGSQTLGSEDISGLFSDLMQPGLASTDAAKLMLA
jgi:hypothetical protein